MQILGLSEAIDKLPLASSVCYYVHVLRMEVVIYIYIYIYSSLDERIQ